MALRTLSTDTLLRRTEKQYAKLEKQLQRDTATLEEPHRPATHQNIRQNIAYTRQRSEKIVKRREEILRLQSTDDQREAYGVERWNREWVRFGDIALYAEARAYLGPRPQKEEISTLQAKIWEKIPACRFKRFQELFVEQENFIVPPFTVNAQGDVDFTGSVDWRRISIAPCLVSIDHIPEELLESLRICSFSDEDRDDVIAWLRKKHDAIPALKLLFESAQAVPHSNDRMLIVEKPSNIVQDRYGDVAAPHDDILGTILYSRERTGQPYIQPSKRRATPRQPRKLMVQHFTSAYEALRKTGHVELTYARELRDLADLAERIRLFNADVDRRSAFIKEQETEGAKEQLRSEIVADTSEFLSSAIEPLQSAVHPMKTEARTMLEEALEKATTQPKPNFSAILAKLVSSFHRLDGRTEEIAQKGNKNNTDGSLLITETATEESALKTFRTFIRSHGGTIGDGNLELFGSRRLTDPQIAFQSRGLLSRLRVHPQDLHAVRLAPLRSYAARIANEYRRLEISLQSRKQSDAIIAVVGMHILGKFQAARTCIEHMKRLLMDTRGIPVDELQRFSAAIQDILHQRELFPSVEHPILAVPYEALLVTMDELRRVVLPIVSPQADLTSRERQFGALREKLDAIDPEAMLPPENGGGTSSPWEFPGQKAPRPAPGMLF